MSQPSLGPSLPKSDRTRGALLGLAAGEALGRPVDKMSHQNVRTYFKGIKGYVGHERTDVKAGAIGPIAHGIPGFVIGIRGDWSAPDFDLNEDQGDAPPDTLPGDAHDVAGGTISVLYDTPHRRDSVLKTLHTAALRYTIESIPDQFDSDLFWMHLEEQAQSTEMAQPLADVRGALDYFPLDLADACGETDTVMSAWLFGVAMFARNPHLVEATLLSAVNVGGWASIVGATAGSLLGALNGWSAFPAEWRDGLTGADDLRALAG